MATKIFGEKRTRNDLADDTDGFMASVRKLAFIGLPGCLIYVIDKP